MSEYRYQPLTDQWTLVAGNRQQRPNEFRHNWLRVSNRPCPFCSGNESETPEALAIYPRYPDSDDWLVRVFPNKFPALFPVPDQPLEEHGPYRSQVGFGLHELIVLSPRHVESLSELTGAEAETSLFAFQDRLRWAYAQPSVRHAVLFQNCRSDAGASIQHVHCQLIGTRHVPPQIAQREQRQREHAGRHGTSLLDAMASFERAHGSRVVDEGPRWTTFCPFASRLPFETWIVPHGPLQGVPFLELDRPSLHELALRRAVRKLEGALPQAAYNVVLHVPPKPDGDESEGDEPEGDDRQGGRWFLELFPRLTKVAGFEWATGCMINQVPPELAAQELRSIQAS